MFSNLIDMLLDNMPYSVWCLNKERQFVFVNDFYSKYMKMSKNDIIGKSIYGVYEYEFAKEYEENYDEVENSLSPKLFTGYQENRFLECYITPLIKENEIIGFLGILKDETKRKLYEEEIVKQKEFLSALIDTIPDAIFLKDTEGKYLDCNVAFAREYYEKDKHDVIGKKDIDLETNDKNKKNYVESDSKVVKSKQKEVVHNKVNSKYMESIKTPILDKEGEVYGIVGVSRDITSKILFQRNLMKMTYTDKLTGIYNRAYYDVKIEKINNENYYPLSLIMGDVDGLKIVNDVLGHLDGDELLIKITSLIKKVCRKEDLIIRWGGDEIIVLLPKTTNKEAEQICEKIKAECKKETYSLVPLSISLGCATKTNNNQDINDILMKAEDRLYKEKLCKQNGTEGNLIKMLDKTLMEKSVETGEHTNRVVEYAIRLGKAMELGQEQQKELELASRLHDIGKIGIPDSILLKPDKLSDLEMQIIKTHTEKGYRIAKINYEVSHVAKSILSHHERWDGLGYPLSLKGEEIPLLARIIAVVDSYDAMTSNRSYKRKMTKKEAFKELELCSGRQFDPFIVDKFLEEFRK